ncbi:MAG: transporter substrate-binding domain-containing protein [Steroidobacteraceae bacterium]
MCHGAPGAPLRFGLTADYPPFALRDAHGELRGADVEAARRIAARLGRPIEFVPTQWTTLAADFAAGRFDVLIGGITVTPERAALGTYSKVLMHDGKRPLVRCADRERYTTAASLDRPDVRVMINRGPSMPALARERFPRANLLVNPDDATLVPYLVEGRVDAWVTDGVVVDHMARRHAGVLCAARTASWTHLEKAWLIRRDAALVRRIDRLLAAELRSGRWRRDLEAVP